MIVLPGRGVTYGELWYEEDPRPKAGVDILVYRRHRGDRAAAGGKAAPQVLTDLSLPSSTIATGFAATCRYEIRRAESRDGLAAEFIANAANSVADFRTFYDAFARQKAIWPADPTWLLAASRSRQLALSTARSGTQPIVWHAYVLSGATAGLHYSCSWCRTGDRDLRALAGRANRWLHWQDMLRFKELGFLRYDWGGLFADETSPERAGINAFKRSFGPRLEPAWDRSVPLTMRGQAWLLLRGALQTCARGLPPSLRPHPPTTSRTTKA